MKSIISSQYPHHRSDLFSTFITNLRLWFFSNTFFFIINCIKAGLIFLILTMQSTIVHTQTDTLVCDNGGFEDDFDYYFGQHANYNTGSNDCTPLSGSNPVSWNSTSLPSFRQLEIVSSGVDTLVGINRTKFGNKALLLNNRYRESGSLCTPGAGIDKIIKRFKVTEQNREFTVWFAAVLENPEGHTNSQPYFSIKCDRAPAFDLCFDASLVKCEGYYIDSICNFDSIIVVVDWTCHRIKLPKNMVDSIATLEIVVADCGQAAHFGYAYVDGICEDCDGSQFGSATLYGNHPLDTIGLGISYNGCLDTLTFCGNYELPDLCANWELDSVRIQGYTIFNTSIDTVHQIFCFDVPLSVFGDTCVELFAALYFSSVINILPPVYSNTIEICPEDFNKYKLEVYTGICQDNATSNLLSDDYYYVQVNLDEMNGDTFTIERWLDDPYPNESGYQIILADTGDGTFNLGPFYIQEGSWMLIFKFEDCSDTVYIVPPEFCSGCEKFYETTIGNIDCDDKGTLNISDDTWTFDINVPGTSGSYQINGSGTYNYGTTYQISGGTIGHTCISITLSDLAISCEAELIICPPKPCSDEDGCEMEVNIVNVYCDEEDTEFYIELKVINVGGLGYLCYKTTDIDGPGTANPNNQEGRLQNQILGPFTDDIWLEIKKCEAVACTCSTPECFKILYVPFPDCENLSFRNLNIKSTDSINEIILKVFPNPFKSNEIWIYSNLSQTNYSLFDLTGVSIKSGRFEGMEHMLKLNVSKGIYFMHLYDDKQLSKIVKLIRI